MNLRAIAKLELRSSTGVYVEDGVVYTAEVAQTPFGARVRDVTTTEATAEIAPVTPTEEPEEASDEEPGRFDEIKAGLARAVAAIQRVRSVSAVGLPAGSGYYVALPAEQREEIAAGGGSLAAYIEGEDTSASGVLSDRVPVKLGKEEFLLVAAAQDGAIRRMLARAGREAAERTRCELAGAAALRCAWREVAPKGLAAELRVWMGERYCLVSLARGRTPFAWEEVPRDGDGWLEALGGAVVRMMTVVPQRAGIEPPTRFIVQGPAPESTLGRLGEVSGLDPEQKGERALDARAIAEGLALGALTSGESAINLARSIQPPPAVLSTVPWAEAAAIVGAASLVGAVLGFKLLSLDRELAMARDRQGQVEWARKLSNVQLSKDAKELRKAVEPLSDYLTGGLSWTPLIADIPDTLPLESWMKQLTAKDSLWARKQKSEYGDRYLLIREAAPLGPGGSVPEGVDDALDSLRASRVGEVFPEIQLTEVQWRREGFSETTGFAVLCQPRGA